MLRVDACRPIADLGPGIKYSRAKVSWRILCLWGNLERLGRGVAVQAVFGGVPPPLNFLKSALLVL